jgi:hypothetical protein
MKILQHLIVVVSVTAFLGGAATLLKGRSWDFEAEEVGKAPQGFHEEVGRWVVAQEGGNRVLAQRAENEDETFNLVLVEGTSYRDLDLSVRVKAGTGEIDQGGGFVWRARDKGNYYIARYNPLESSLRVYKVEDGERTQLDHADVPADHKWHTIRITMTGREALGYFDGKKVLVAEDRTFAEPGMVGLWSKADARSAFDDLKVEGK